jgi:hypothetical protein
LAAAAAAAAVGGGQQRMTVSMAMNGNSGQPPPPLMLAAARQSLADNGRWPAEGWWEAELFTNKIVGVYTCCAWAGGTFFPVVLLCQFLVVAGNRFQFYLLCTYVLRLQYSCGVVLVFWF